MQAPWPAVDQAVGEMFEAEQAAGLDSGGNTQTSVGVPDALQGIPVSAPGQEGRQQGMGLAALRV